MKSSRQIDRARRSPVTFSEDHGIRFLHFGTEWIQGAMRISRPDVIVLDYVQQMMAWTLFLDAPAAIGQLGLGAAALTKFCYRHFPDTRLTAVDLNPAVVVAARVMFAMPAANERFDIVVDDADAFVRAPAQRGRFDVLQVDLYDAKARGPVLESAAFYAACRACLREPGVLTVNLFGAHASFGRNVRALQTAFDGRVVVLPEVHEGNRIAIAFNGPPLSVSWGRLERRAIEVRRQLGLPAGEWVDALRASEGSCSDRASFRV